MLAAVRAGVGNADALEVDVPCLEASPCAILVMLRDVLFSVKKLGAARWQQTATY